LGLNYFSFHDLLGFDLTAAGQDRSNAGSINEETR